MPMMKRWMILMIATLMVCVSVIPSAAVNKVVNNDREGEKPFFLNDCDSAKGWVASGGVTVALDEDESTEGFGSVRFTADVTAYSNATIYIRADFEEEYLRDADYITFDFYISHPELIESSYQSSVMIGSGGSSSNKICEWKAAMFTQEYVAGWNTITLPLTSVQTFTADMTEIDNFRLYFKYINLPKDVKDLTIRIDNIEVHSYGSKAISLVNCDTPEHWSSVDAIESNNHKEGEGALVFYTQPVTVPDANFNLIRQINLPVPLDCSNADFFEFDMYVSDASALHPSNSKYGLIFEITSSGRCDVEEYTWDSEYYYGQLKNGWNHIKLPIASAGTSGGAPNMKAINYFRMHLLELQTAKDDLLTIMLDNMYLSVTQDGVDDYAQPEPAPEPDPEPQPEPEPVPGQPSGGEVEFWPGGEMPEEDVDVVAARKALTARRARSLAIIFVFMIIGANVVVAALTRRQEDETLVVDGDRAAEMLQASVDGEPGQTEQLNDVPNNEPTEN